MMTSLRGWPFWIAVLCLGCDMRSLDTEHPMGGGGASSGSGGASDGGGTVGDGGISADALTDQGPPPIDGVGGLGRTLCGNGVLDPGEQCDDGNKTPGDGCS